MKTLKTFENGGVPQGGPTGGESRDFYGNIVEGYTEEELNRLRQLQREYDKAEMGIVGEGFREFSSFSKAQPHNTRGRDIMNYQQSLMREIDNLQREIEVRSGAAETMSEARAHQEMLESKGIGLGIDTSKIPVREDRLSTFAQGGTTPMSFVKPKSRY
jgi:hypothetical protein